jgi:hypothetical protein
MFDRRLKMKSHTLILGAGLASALLALAPAQAAPADPGHDAAIKACSTVNPAQPVTVLSAVNDGSGNVYTYSLIGKDLLKGTGGELLGLQPTANGGFVGQPQKIAEKVCAAYLVEGGTVLMSTPDGLENDPGFAVFVADKNGAQYLCNATGDAMIWAFEPIGDPLSFPTQTS